jgi:hypothetical protein
MRISGLRVALLPICSALIWLDPYRVQEPKANYLCLKDFSLILVTVFFFSYIINYGTCGTPRMMIVPCVSTGIAP